MTALNAIAQYLIAANPAGASHVSSKIATFVPTFGLRGYQILHAAIPHIYSCGSISVGNPKGFRMFSLPVANMASKNVDVLRGLDEWSCIGSFGNASYLITKNTEIEEDLFILPSDGVNSYRTAPSISVFFEAMTSVAASGYLTSLLPESKPTEADMLYRASVKGNYASPWNRERS